MADFFDYLHWRGDLDFSHSPFNEVDAAIFSMLSYLDMAGIVPGRGSAPGITIQETSAQYFMKFPSNGDQSNANKNTAAFEALLRQLSTCPRFASVHISRFEADTDYVVGRQFAALTFSLPKPRHEHIVVFRGTDKTLVGWKEDFGWFYKEQIPAQDSACRYLEHALAHLPGQFFVCGHSKGGNLAIYAGAHASTRHQDRILKIFNFDGPGFDFSFIDRGEFSLCEHKILNFVPEESMAGMLLESVGQRMVISSSARYLSQHNAIYWKVEPTEFARGQLADVAKLLDHTLKAWVSDISLAEREAILQAFFGLLDASEGTVTLSDPLGNLRVIRKVLKKYSQFDKETRSLLNQVFGSLTTQTTRTVSRAVKQKLPANVGKSVSDLRGMLEKN